LRSTEKVVLLEEFLNVSGQDGWEVVGVASAPGANFTHLVYLKRPGDMARSELSGVADSL